MPEFRTTFTTPYQRHADREGQPFTVLAFIDQADAEHNAETLPIYRIRFADGFVTDAWPEEVETADSRARQWLEFTLDSGDHGVGWLRWRFTYDQRHGEPADALEQASSAVSRTASRRRWTPCPTRSWPLSGCGASSSATTTRSSWSTGCSRADARRRAGAGLTRRSTHVRRLRALRPDDGQGQRLADTPLPPPPRPASSATARSS